MIAPANSFDTSQPFGSAPLAAKPSSDTSKLVDGWPTIAGLPAKFKDRAARVTFCQAVQLYLEDDEFRRRPGLPGQASEKSALYVSRLAAGFPPTATAPEQWLGKLWEWSSRGKGQLPLPWKFSIETSLDSIAHFLARRAVEFAMRSCGGLEWPGIGGHPRSFPLLESRQAFIRSLWRNLNDSRVRGLQTLPSCCTDRVASLLARLCVSFPPAECSPTNWLARLQDWKRDSFLLPLPWLSVEHGTTDPVAVHLANHAIEIAFRTSVER
ncbi:MAG: hypothetical protein AAF802_07595 [Planctomycetota bacterium]